MKDNSLEKKIRALMRIPVWFSVVIFIAWIVGHYIRPDLDGAYGMIFVVYTIVAVIFYLIAVRLLRRSMLRFGIGYGVLQRELLSHIELPYALVESDGRVLWINSSFSELTEKPHGYKKAISTIFPAITKEWLEKVSDDHNEIEIEFAERHFVAKVQRINMKEMLATYTLTMEDKADEEEINYAITLFEDTETLKYMQMMKDQKLVTGIVCIDNYEDTSNNLEEVKRAMLMARVDELISDYFAEKFGGIVRKLEKDRYFVVFQQQYLHEYEEDKYSILETVKKLNLGNMPITLSIGIGLDGESYKQKAEFAKSALDLALGRGGDQVVEKSPDGARYYGGLSQATANNTRVKSRVKAQALRELIRSHERVIVMGHKKPDTDSLGSAVGIYAAGKALGKQVQIVVGDTSSSLRPFVNSLRKDDYPPDLIITPNEAQEIITSRMLIVVVDTNRPSQGDCPYLLTRGGNVVVIDHHRQTEDVIEKPVMAYIEPHCSSACEMITEMLQYFPEKIKLLPEEADCLYSGVIVDTDNFLAKSGVRTFEAAAFLRRCGADSTRARKLLREDFNSYKARIETVRKAIIYNNSFAISSCDSANVESPHVLAAQAANELLNIDGVKASFVLSRYQDELRLSARSIDEVNVQKVCERFNGGGHFSVAGCQFDPEKYSFESVTELIENTLDDMIEKGEIEI